MASCETQACLVALHTATDHCDSRTVDYHILRVDCQHLTAHTSVLH